MTSSPSISWDGLAEFYAQLRALPDELAAEGGEIVREAATKAAADLRKAYPVRSGNLAEHVVLLPVAGGRYGAVYMVKNTAHHAWLFENGTQGKTRYFHKASRGPMPAGHIFIPIMIRARRQMQHDLADLLRRAGLTVSIAA